VPTRDKPSALLAAAGSGSISFFMQELKDKSLKQTELEGGKAK
jgi:hypothetical protein